MVKSLHVLAEGKNYLHHRQLAKSGQNAATRESYAQAATQSHSNLHKLATQLEREIYATGKSLALRAASITPEGWGNEDDYEFSRYLDGERELDRLEALRDEVGAYLDGRDPGERDPEVRVTEEAIALATRARVGAAARRFTGNGSRGSYDGEVIQALIEKGIAKESRHAVHILNLSKGLEEGWGRDELVFWATVYRKAREAGESKPVSVAVANKALEIG